MAFRFKRFEIRDERCAMKVGTDGVLLGAWGCVEGHSILDIGTGSGLIALMAAQRNPQAKVLGIDIDEAAVQQAKENIDVSPFSDRVSCILQDVLTFQPETSFDAILCNPPFFTEDTLPDDTRRALARNNKSLPFAELIPKVATLLSDKGTFSTIIPNGLVQEFVGICLAEGLHLTHRCLVRTTSRKPPRRAMLAFSSYNCELPSVCTQTDLCLTNPDGSRSIEYTKLTNEFYL